MKRGAKMEKTREDSGKRHFLKTVKGAVVLVTIVGMAIAITFPMRVEAQPKPIKIAIIEPLSGALSRNGNLGLQGAKGIVKWINDQGGIKSMGGRKLQLVWADSSSATESAATAMERLIRDPEVVLATDGWASSFEMSSTEVTERAQVLQFNTGFSDALSTRGFKWGFYVSPPAMEQGRIGLKNVIDLARGHGQVIKTAMIVGDNQAAGRAFYDACRALLPPMGVTIISEEVYAMGTLTDATAIVQKVKAKNPDVVMFFASAISECQMILMKKKEMGINIPFIGNGGWACDPSFAAVGAETLEGFTTFTPCFPNKKTPQVWLDYLMAQSKAEYSDEAYPAQELCWPLTMYPIIATGLEQAGTLDRHKLWEVFRKMDLPPGNTVLGGLNPGAMLAGQAVAFDETGRIAKKYQNVVVVQWQSGRPKTIWPPDLAMASPLWKFEKK